MFGLDEILTHSLAYAVGEDEGRAKAKKEDNNTWHTGTPTEAGWYLTKIKGQDFYFATRYYGDKHWDKDNIVEAWQKIEPYKEN